MLYLITLLIPLLLLTTFIPNTTQTQLTVAPTADVTTQKCDDSFGLQRNVLERRFSTKTPYRAIANYNDTSPIYNGCHPTRIWSIIRHGTRNPSKSVILHAKTRLVELQSLILQQTKPPAHLCADDLKQLRRWNWDHIEPDDEKLLVAEGEDELIELAERMQLRFPKLLPDLYNPEWYYMKYTATQRTLKSAQSFATGLFGRHRIHAITYPQPLKRDPVLRFYKLCSRWKTDVDKNPETMFNARSFYAEPAMQSAVEQVRSSTQLSDELTDEDVQLMYTVCAFETAWQRHKSPSVWCRFFDVHSLSALEFAEDLEYYWNDGYGYDLTHRIACPAIADMFATIDTPGDRANATFYFTHSGTLLKMLAHLGVARDERPLTHKDFGKDRLWRTSEIDAFATNLAFVRYDCIEKEPQVLVMHQERVVRLPGCPQDDDLCPLSTLRRNYADSVERCDFEALCQAAN
ncbi:multiple inositol polyphosphate phosphatase 1-like isoform X2 [Drosophila sulfurigaster albostrigata]|uniref:multiple inositol polyphosphate phosphatase 1-like isoform X2 n=1 Tax=Drosophila sulfurigaster albostrigata TaxID=89887 RepID=UPI002D21AEFF|nr:multiple inositol polyphosphate phosphatase 1-like isoform X2 [Drosophila sulfurigaster albostrigata]